MMLGLGVGGYAAGTFHLMTHAFFKALLFLCAGSVIHSLHTQDIREMGGLLSKMKITGTTFIIGALAISGVPPFSGFWSKDEILAEAAKSHPALFIVAALTSLLTAFYMARLIFLVLFGKAKKESRAHESPQTMTFPLIVLAVFAVFAGFLGSPFLHHAFQNFLALDAHGVETEPNTRVMILGTTVSLVGILAAYLVYMQGVRMPESLRAPFRPLYKLLLNKYYIDEIYDAVFVKPSLRLCKLLFSFDMSVVDGAVNGVAVLVGSLGKILRNLQTGLVQNYVFIQVLGVVIFLCALIGKLCLRF